MDVLALGDAHPAVQAAVWFLAERERYWAALFTHQPAEDGLCATHNAVWPCFTYWLADTARRLMEGDTMPIPRITD